MVLASASHLIIVSIDDRLGRGIYIAVALMDIGEMSAILTSQLLIGQVTVDRGCDATIGVFSMLGTASILMASLVGGILRCLEAIGTVPAGLFGRQRARRIRAARVL